MLCYWRWNALFSLCMSVSWRTNLTQREVWPLPWASGSWSPGSWTTLPGRSVCLSGDLGTVTTDSLGTWLTGELWATPRQADLQRNWRLQVLTWAPGAAGDKRSHTGSLWLSARKNSGHGKCGQASLAGSPLCTLSHSTAAAGDTMPPQQQDSQELRVRSLSALCCMCLLPGLVLICIFSMYRANPRI